MHVILHLLYLVPKNLLSRWAGYLAAIRLAPALRKPFFKAFGQFFGINFEEIAEPLESFERLQDFFIRELKPGLRPIDQNPNSIVSPCDGVFGACGQIESGRLFQVKNKTYTLSTLLGESRTELENGYYATIYLSPKDYHRFHAPCSASLTRARYIPGHLWPVNAWGIQNIDQLFCVNERIVCWLGDSMALVAVGATLVGKVKFACDPSLTTNTPNTSEVLKHYSPAIPFKKGQELGYFEFGSTVVLVSKHPLEGIVSGDPVKLGQRIGTL